MYRPYKLFLLVFALFVTTIMQAQKQQRSLSGLVLNADLKPLSGVAIRLEGSTETIYTERDGSFRLSCPTDKFVLSISKPYMLEELRFVPKGTKPVFLSVKMQDRVLGLPEVEVVGYRGTSPFVQTTQSVLRVATPIQTIPLSVDVVTRQKMEQQQALSLGEVTAYIAGLSRVSTGEANNVSENFSSRGFGLSNSRNFFKDGMRYRKVSNMALSSVERIEFLRGPSSGAYGAVEPGGIINIITRPALYSPRYQASVRLGSYGLRQIDADLSAPLNSKKSVRYRLGAMHESSDSYRPQVSWSKWQFSPRLDIDLGKKTSLTLNAEYFSDHRVVDPGVPHVGGKVLNDKLFVGAPWAKAKFHSMEAGYKLSHQFSSAFKFNSQFRYTNLSEDRLYFQMKAIKKDKMERRLANWDASIQYYTWQNELISEFNTMGLEHKLLLGLEYEHSDNRRFVHGDTFAAIDLINPAYPDKPADLSKLKKSSDLAIVQNNIGVYAQDFVALSNKLYLLLGARADWSWERNTNYMKNSEPVRTSPFALSPRLGLTFRPWEAWSVYASYSSSFVPTSGQTKEGKPFDPTYSKQWELGTKANLIDNKLSLGLAVYQLTKTNVLTPDLEDPKYKIQIGEQFSRGVELSMQAELYDGLRAQLSYAYTTGEVSRTNDKKIPVGSKLANTPKHNASLWATYAPVKGFFKGLSLGGGVHYQAKRFGNATNTITLPAYVSADAFVAYSTGRYKVSLNAKNITNKRYYLAAQGANLFTLAPPRSLQMSFGVTL